MYIKGVRVLCAVYSDPCAQGYLTKLTNFSLFIKNKTACIFPLMPLVCDIVIDLLYFVYNFCS